MRYRVIVTPEAESGILESFGYINERSPLNAARWLRALYRQIDTLERFPERCPTARESQYLDEHLRQLVFKSHRIVFRIERATNTVWVLYVRHGRRRAVGEPSGDD